MRRSLAAAGLVAAPCRYIPGRIRCAVAVVLAFVVRRCGLCAVAVAVDVAW